MNRGRPGTLPARKNLSRQIFATPLPKFGARAPLGLPPPTYRTIDHKQKCAASTQNRGTPPRSWTAVEMPAATVAAGWVTAVRGRGGVPVIFVASRIFGHFLTRAQTIVAQAPRPKKRGACAFCIKKPLIFQKKMVRFPENLKKSTPFCPKFIILSNLNKMNKVTPK